MSSQLSTNPHTNYNCRNYTNTEFSLFLGPIVTRGPEQSERLRHRNKTKQAYSVSSSLKAIEYEIHYRNEPKIVNGYHIGDVLGEGTYGKVREAYDMKRKKYVAMKILSTRKMRKTHGGEDNVRREIFIMKRLKHPNVIALLDYFEDKSHENLYIILELVGGGSLQTKLERSGGRMDEVETKWYFRQLINGLEYIHNQGIVHRDIKPSNLMISNDGVLKISDFGVSELLSSKLSGEAYDTIASTYKGTPSFAAPEIATGDDFVSGFKIDVWAVGVTLFLLVTGKVPFHGTTLFNLFEAINQGYYEVPNGLDSDLENLLNHLLDPDQYTRYSIKDIKNHPWLTSDDNISIKRPLFSFSNTLNDEIDISSNSFTDIYRKNSVSSSNINNYIKNEKSLFNLSKTENNIPENSEETENKRYRRIGRRNNKNSRKRNNHKLTNRSTNSESKSKRNNRERERCLIL